MSIKSLADELRESLKNGNPEKPVKTSRSKPVTLKADPKLLELFAKIESFELAGQEKLLIRLDERTIFLLRQLKVAKGIDMNRTIAFVLNDFFSQHPQLIQFIKDNIKTLEL